MEDNYQLILLRHGESEGNVKAIYQGQADFPLTEAGRYQVEGLAKQWQISGRQFDLIVSSPLSRAYKTAEIIAKQMEIPRIQVDADWMERNFGLINGLTHQEANERYPWPAFTNPYQPVGPGGESQWELYLRAGKAIQKILRFQPGRYLVVSHGAILNMAMNHIVGVTPTANFQGVRYLFANTGYASLQYHPALHRWDLEYFGS